MGRLIVLFISFVICIHVNAQDSTLHFKLQRTITGECSDFTVDELGNIFLVINNTQIKKINRNGDSIAVFGDVKRYGNIHSIDASNPFKVLVFYKSTGTIVILDRLLGVKQVVDLRKQNILQATAIRQSYDNNIWVFDELTSKIKKIDDNGRLLSESADLRNVFAVTPSFESIFDNNRSLYLYDPKLGWFAFDYYGAFKKKYAFTNWKDVQVISDQLIGRDDNHVFLARMNDLDFSQSKSNVLFKTAIKVFHAKKISYVLYADRLEIYDAP